MADDNPRLSGRPDVLRPRRVVTAPVECPPPAPTPTPAPTSTLPPSSSSSTSTSTPTSSSRSEDLVETLYSHPSVKIIAFTSTQRASFGSRKSSTDVDRPGTLPASSRLERTIAVGPFRIYRAPGSVAFLSCGSALQPILPKSQCWCIDEENSRFVLQIRRPQYWRIELPVSDPDDQERALLLRDILDKALLFEKTACPFQRSFTVELPEELEVRKKAWTPDGKNLISDPFLPIVSPSPKGFGGDQRANLLADQIASFRVDIGTINELDESRFKRWQSENPEEPEITEFTEGKDYSARYYNNLNEWRRADAASADTFKDLRTASNIVVTPKPQRIAEELSDNTSVGKEEMILDSGKEEEATDEPSSFEGSGRVAPMNLTRKRMSRMLAGRAFTAPPQLSVITSPPSKSTQLSSATSSHPPPPPPPPPPQRLGSDDNSPVGSTDSFHSTQSWHSPIAPLPPSPPSSRPVTPSISQFPHPHENIVLPRPSSQGRDNRVFMRTPDTDRTFIPSSAGLTDHADDLASPLSRCPSDSVGMRTKPISAADGSSNASHASASEEAQEIQLRPRPRINSLSFSRPALSPLPSAINFFSPPQRQTSRSRMDVVRRLPGAIIQKTVEMLLAPPTHLVNLMLKVAAKIASGEWRGLVFGFGEGGERIPVQWDYSDGEFSDWSDDEDYAMAKSKQSSNSSIPQTADGSRRDSAMTKDNRSWEVD
ncbi:inheritance of peroxisomes protein 1-domain-containing protein [Annulohypoxylon maeteangense]|uniref:inheritance of peroxisomes protein 1-domain-containing protein n=1 Tax=Annulohypoxylon maeteangense TaxID=1927788 RepID=UPI002007F99C|nr:inheritance of peroxisomes protein 1-domain-containing protein [Annulohypoxylon maeteangense]KAI0879836.1 inheritance of peroxisomes protein 1-domain-containing protein [Annulohypoxylon maeteangense]